MGLELTGVFLGSLFVFVGVQAAYELLIRKTHRKESTGLIFDAKRLRNHLSIKRSLAKLFGMYGTLGALAVVYMLVPQYANEYYRPFWDLVVWAAPGFVVLSIPYFILIDALMAEPRDGYWYAGRLFLVRREPLDWKLLKEYSLGWVIKGFFLPIMMPALIGVIEALMEAPPDWSFVQAVYEIAKLALCVDLCFVVVGYMFTVRILDSHIRSTNPYLWGWIVCIVMYKPFWTYVGLMIFLYQDEREWYVWFADTPWLLYVWGTAVILSKIGWAWSNIMFGFRFSNLTNRGIITNGPFRFTKHPSYLCKNISWWLLSVPFLSQAGFSVAFTHSVALIGINVLYMIRATSEELHLSEEPDYVAYALWINDHGVLRWVGRLLPWLRYRPPRGYVVQHG